MSTERGSDRHTAMAGGAHRRFFQFTIGQLLLLLAVSSVLLGLMAPAIQRRFHEWRLDEGFRKTAIADAELAAAIRANDLSAARHALEAGAKPDRDYSSVPTGWLSTCIRQGKLEMMKLLLEFGADVERTAQVPDGFRGGADYSPALFIAVRCDQPPEIRCQMIRLLVDHGADLQSQHWNNNLMDAAFDLSDGQIGDLLHEYGFPYGPREMTGFNRLDELKQAVDDDPDLLSKRFPTNFAGQPPTLLGIALRRGYREMALFLIDAGAPLDTIEHQGSTLLHEAVRGGDLELIQLLLARGLDVDATDDYKDTPLSEYAGRKPLEVVAALIAAGADVNHQGGNRQTPLHGAVWNNRIDVVETLVAAGADPTVADVHGHTPLDIARGAAIRRGSKGNPAIAKLLEQAAKLPAKGQ